MTLLLIVQMKIAGHIHVYHKFCFEANYVKNGLIPIGIVVLVKKWRETLLM
jgi:hypothetical protein